MRRWIFVAFMAVSCTTWALFPMPRSRTETSGHRPPVQAVEEAADRDRHVYLTAVTWPSGYDWQRDTAGGRAELLLLCDGETRMRTSLLDGSVHRFRNGALWEAGLQEGETVLRRNGEEFLRWEGEESLKGFLPETDGVYTLTQRVGAPGVRLRRNGELLFSDDRGIVLGSMEESGWDGGALERDGEGSVTATLSGSMPPSGNSVSWKGRSLCSCGQLAPGQRFMMPGEGTARCTWSSQAGRNYFYIRTILRK